MKSVQINWRGACINSVSDFLGHIFFLIQLSSIFAWGLPLHRKTYPPILVCWFLFRFPHITHAKTQFSSWWRPFQTELLFFQTIQSAKHAFATTAGPGKPAFLLRYFSKTKNKTAVKITKKNWRAQWKQGTIDIFWPIFVFRCLKWTQLPPVTMPE